MYKNILYNNIQKNYLLWAVLLHILLIICCAFFSNYNTNQDKLTYVATLVTLGNNAYINNPKNNTTTLINQKNSNNNTNITKINKSDKNSHQINKKDKFYKIKTLQANNVYKMLDKSVNNSPIQYPYSAKLRKQEGLLILLVTINKHGKVQEIKVEQSTGFETLDTSALKTVNNWKFKVSLLDYKNTLIRLPIQFLIN